jgi:glycosyltransferase involved in cell wall biosynthesis
VKILFLDQYSEMGGAQRVLVDTIDAALVCGWEVHAAIPGAGPLVEQLRSRGIPVSGIPCGPYRSSRKSAMDHLRFAFDLRGQIRILRSLADHTAFDLWYVNGPRLLPAAALARGLRTAVLFHAHSHIQQASVAKLAAWSIRRTNAAVVACSNSVLEPLSPCVQRKSYVIPNGVREMPFHDRQFGREQTWRIGMIARISPEKGQAEFLKAAALVALEFPNLEFVICGAPLFGESKYWDLVRGLGAGLPVEFLGWKEDVEDVFAELDLLVAPSKQEGMGRTLVEAFSAGVPAVAFPTGGIAEVIIDGQTGFLTPEPSADSLAKRIQEIITMDPERVRGIVARARRSWELHYTVANYQRRITEVMSTLVSASGAERETETRPSHR